MADVGTNDPLWQRLARRLDDRIVDVTQISNAAFGPTFKLNCRSRPLFVKLSFDRDRLAAEHDGLLALNKGATIKVPKPVALETIDSVAALVSQYIELHGSKSDYSRLADDLVALHLQTGASHGWHRDNYIGQTHQINTPGDNWAEFFVHHRLVYQLEMAWDNGYSGQLRALGEQLPAVVTEILRNHNPRPALLHGDLWSGNFGFDKCGAPVIFDPAVYFGDPETDLAMTRLFGAPPDVFYARYHQLNPLPEGWPLRALVYNLYHVLNHLNIFGPSYLSQAEQLSCRILSQAD